MADKTETVSHAVTPSTERGGRPPLFERLRGHLAWRMRQCRRDVSVMVAERHGALRILRNPDVDVRDVLAMLEEHRSTAAARDSRLIKGGTKTVVTRLRRAGGAQDLCVKETRCRTVWDRIDVALRGACSSRAYLAGHAFLAETLPTARPIAAVEQHSMRGYGTSYLITDYLRRARPLNVFARRRDRMSAEEKIGLISALARAVWNLHRRGIYHRDLSPKNVLVRLRSGSPWEVFFIDLDSIQSWIRPTKKRRLRNLSQLADVPQGVSEEDRLRLWKEYAALEPGLVTDADFERLEAMLQSRVRRRTQQ